MAIHLTAAAAGCGIMDQEIHDIGGGGVVGSTAGGRLDPAAHVAERHGVIQAHSAPTVFQRQNSLVPAPSAISIQGGSIISSTTLTLRLEAPKRNVYFRQEENRQTNDRASLRLLHQAGRLLIKFDDKQPHKKCTKWKKPCDAHRRRVQLFQELAMAGEEEPNDGQR